MRPARSFSGLAVGLLLALVSAPQPTRAAELPLPPAEFEAKLVELGEHVRQRTVLIYGLIGLGSGAVVGHDGTIVTNAHVVAASRYALVQWADGRTVLAKRRGIDYGRDLAVLVPEEPLPEAVPAFALAAASPAEGQWVVACGFPGGLRTTDAPTVSVGTIMGFGAEMNVGGMLDYQGALRSDTPIFSGNSGGPLVDLEGRLVGINGAVDLERAVSLTIPVGVVRERMAQLTDEQILLPGGRTISPRENRLLEGLYDALDPIARRLPERVAEASRQAASATESLPLDLVPAGEPGTSQDRMAGIARDMPRQRALDSAFAGPATDGMVAVEDAIHLTPVSHLHVVCKASLLGAREQLTVGALTARRIAVSEADDLALLQLSDPQEAAPVDAPLSRVGSLIHVRGRTGLLASGIVSAEARPTSASVLARIQGGGGMGDQLEGALGFAEGLADRLGIAQVQELIEQIRKSIEVRRQFAAGTPPRSYAEVLSVDAPLPPSMAGAPVYDLEGRLVGPSVGVAHHGTAYVVPMLRVRQVFAAHLPGGLYPEHLGEARLY